MIKIVSLLLLTIRSTPLLQASQSDPVNVEFRRNAALPSVFREATIKNQDGSSLHFYINDPGAQPAPRPLIIWLDDSGCGSHFAWVRRETLNPK